MGLIDGIEYVVRYRDAGDDRLWARYCYAGMAQKVAQRLRREGRDAYVLYPDGTRWFPC